MYQMHRYAHISIDHQNSWQRVHIHECKHSMSMCRVYYDWPRIPDACNFNKTAFIDLLLKTKLSIRYMYHRLWRRGTCVTNISMQNGFGHAEFSIKEIRICVVLSVAPADYVTAMYLRKLNVYDCVRS